MLNPLARKAHRPLDAWLAATPPHKPFVIANYRSLNTGVIGVRASAEGRALLDEVRLEMTWHSVAHTDLVPQ